MSNNINKNYASRGYLPDSFMKKLRNTCYPHIIKTASEEDSDLDIQFRGGKINIYYLGGSLLRLEGQSVIYFDENYYHVPDRDGMRSSDMQKLRHDNYDDILKNSPSKRYSSANPEEKYKAHIEAKRRYAELIEKRNQDVKRLKKASTEQDVREILDQMKNQMCSWKNNLVANKWLKEEKSERSVQHYISLYNKNFDLETDFIVLDIEYAVSSESAYSKKNENGKPTKQQPRADIIALDQYGQLYVLELKYGMKSVGENADDKASASAHVKDFRLTMGGENWQDFMNDVKVLFETKKREKLLDEHVKLDITKCPKFAFIMKCEKESDKQDFEDYLHSNDITTYDTFYLPSDGEEGYPKSKYKLSKRFLCR